MESWTDNKINGDVGHMEFLLLVTRTVPDTGPAWPDSEYTTA